MKRSSDLTFKQLTALAILAKHDKLTGPAMYDAMSNSLSTWGERLSHPNFYQIMNRLFNGKLIEGSYQSFVKDTQHGQSRSYRERVYQISPHGRQMLEECVSQVEKWRAPSVTEAVAIPKVNNDAARGSRWVSRIDVSVDTQGLG
jgi:DNA-binding PadR family transcriptional regulator